MHRLTSFLLFLLLLSTLPVMGQDSASSEKPRVALLLNTKAPHSEEFDAALESLGWTAERFTGSPEDMDALPDRLGDFDLIIVAPLFGPLPWRRHG